MKIVRQYGPRDVRVEKADEPEPGPQELKIRVRPLNSIFVFLFPEFHGLIELNRLHGEYMGARFQKFPRCPISQTMTGMRVSSNTTPTEHDELMPLSLDIVTRVTQSQR